MVTIAPEAAQKIKELLKEKDSDGKEFKPATAGLRIFVQGGGCSGFQYGLQIENEPSPTDIVSESNEVKVFVDPISIKYLDNVEIHWADSLIGGGFQIKNPDVKGTCGCGQSFDP